MLRTIPTLTRYLIRQFLFGAGLVFALLSLVMFTAEVIEHVRRASGIDEIGLSLIVQFSLLKIPSVIEKLWPFVVLFGGMLALTRLSRSNELVVARAAGVSIWQILTPLVLSAAIIGFFLITVFNPLAAALTGKYEQLASAKFRGETSRITVSDQTGLWLREVNADGHQVIHAWSASAQGTSLDNPTFFTFTRNNSFVRRIDAESAELLDRQWRLKDAVVTELDSPRTSHEFIMVPTRLTVAQIIDSLAPPQSLSFWELPAFIELLEKSGFNALAHRLHWNSLLSLPLMLASMVLLAATFCIRLSVRRGGVGLVFFAGTIAGFAIFFVTDVVEAFGSAGKLPVVLAAWTPAAVTTMTAIAAMFHLEDG